jgi:SAM-dependent methyltransferase
MERIKKMAVTLTEQSQWDKIWDRCSLPQLATRESSFVGVREILRIFDRFLPDGCGKTALEIGGAPGGFLAHVAKQYGYQAFALDYSSVGCAKTRENFRMLDMEVRVYEQDLFSPAGEVPLCDLVFSLGFIEHFRDTETIIGRHLSFLKPDGFLVIGVPNYRGIYLPFLKWYAPDLLKTHDLNVMDLCSWTDFENKFLLDVVFKGYIGGFQPVVLRSILNQHTASFHDRYKIHRFIDLLLGGILKLDHHLYLQKVFARFNSSLWSCYALAIYQKPKLNKVPEVE